MPLVLPEERVGTLLADKYRLDRILGRGGMGIVMAGVHTWTDRPVAVKLLAPELTGEREIVSRFLREARVAAKLKHPNVVDVLDMGTTDDGAVLMVLELLEGESLFALLEREERLAPSRALSLVLPVIDALAFAHERDVVHRDVKPENVFLAVDARGRVVPKLLDFGIAKVREADRTRATQTGTVIGTPYYMSPEQAQGAKDLGPASDVWAAGVVLYECLSGALPFEAESSTAVLAAILTLDPIPLARRLPDAPPRVVAAIDRALTRDMNERYANARAFLRALIDAAREDGVPLEDLEEVLTGMLASSPPGPRSEPPESAAAAISERATMHVHDTPPAARLARSMESKRGAAEPSPEDDAPAPRSEPSPPLDGAPRASRAPWLVAAAAVVVALGLGAWGLTREPAPPALPEASAPAPAPAEEVAAEEPSAEAVAPEGSASDAPPPAPEEALGEDRPPRRDVAPAADPLPAVRRERTAPRAREAPPASEPPPPPPSEAPPPPERGANDSLIIE